MNLLEKTITAIEPLYNDKMEEAQEKLNNLLKPPGSLGKLEDIARQLAGITGQLNNRLDKKTIVIMGSDNGIVEEGISSFPKDVSLLVAETMIQLKSGVAVLAKHAGAGLKIVDLGLDGELSTDLIIDRKIRRGTSNFAKEPAMTRDEALQAIETGIDITNMAIDEGAHLLGTGEIGIGNTTTSSAVLHAFSGASLDTVVGKGAGLSDEGLQHKKDVIEKAVELHRPDSSDVLDVLSKVGGFDIAGLTGSFLAAAARRTPIVIDGFISGVAAVAASIIEPKSTDYMFASHVSVEPGTAVINELLGLEPMLNMNMRLGEGTGCALAFNIIEAATVMMNEMGTFADIGM